MSTTTPSPSHQQHHVGHQDMSSRLAALRGLIPKILVGHEGVSVLEKLANSWMLSSTSSSTFGEESELVTSLLYITLTVHDGFTVLQMQDFVSTFLQRWVEDGGRTDFQKVTSFFKREWRCSCTEVFILLCANVMPGDWGKTVLKEDFSMWGNDWLPHLGPPDWLMDALGCGDDLSDFITVLKVSAYMIQGVTIPKITIKEDSYLGSLARFLDGVSQYQQGEYASSLDTLHRISLDACDQTLQAWVSHIEGLGLAKLDKPHTALVKLQDAVNKALTSLPALYNTAQIFHNLGQHKAELEVLDLLVKSEGEEVKSPQCSLNLSLLSLHHATPKDIISRAQYYLSCRYYEEKKFLEAAENLEMVLDRESDDNGRTRDRGSGSLLRPEDTLPSLPGYSVVVMMAALSHASTHNHKQTLRILDHKFMDKDLNGSMFYHENPEDRLRIIVSAAGQILRVEALTELDQESDALKELIRLEQSMWWVRGGGGVDSSSSSDTVVVQMKALIYRMLSDIHQTRSNFQNHSHYTRLAKQCLDMVTRMKENITRETLLPSDQLAMDALCDYFNNRLYHDNP